jgi:hypothetical protein
MIIVYDEIKKKHEKWYNKNIVKEMYFRSKIFLLNKAIIACKQKKLNAI